MGEFFAARQYRRHGAGRRMATALFERYAGEWIVRQLLTNRAAQMFWRSIIADYTGGKFTETQEHFADDQMARRYGDGRNDCRVGRAAGSGEVIEWAVAAAKA